MLKCLAYGLFFCVFSLSLFSQKTQDDLIIKTKDSLVIPTEEIDILAPSKAAFYSAVLPGLGQIYNKKYWKVPLVYAAIGTGVYFYIDNTDLFNRYKEAYKLRLAGRQDEFTSDSGVQLLSDDALERAQNLYKKNRDLSLFVTIGLYILNIVEANVDAHLPDKALNTNISFSPKVFTSPVTSQAMYGATITFNF